MQKPFDHVSAQLGHSPGLPTNRNLKRLLLEHLGLNLDATFATNLFPFIKQGGISSTIPMRDLVRAAREFAIPQIEIVSPKIVVCLGMNTFNALRLASGMDAKYPMASAIASPFHAKGVRIWCQAHTGSRGQNSRGRAQVALDWDEMRVDLLRFPAGS
jgi:restriction system protein